VSHEVTEFQQSRRPVVLLTLREAQAIHAALEQHLGVLELELEAGDLGRGYRVLSRQLEWCTQGVRRNGWVA